jgi:hypothetical protein
VLTGERIAQTLSGNLGKAVVNLGDTREAASLDGGRAGGC